MAFDGNELQRLEQIFLVSRNNKDLGILYVALLPAGRTLLKAYMGKIGLKLPLSRQKEIVHDASTRLLEMYLKHPNQGSIPLASRMHLELVFQLHNPKQIRVDQCADIPIHHSENAEDDEEPVEVKNYTNLIAEDESVNGKRIVYDLYKNKYYKRAILAIAQYTSKKWIYEHAVELRTIFLHTRKE